jgi:hypothetical protein
VFVFWELLLHAYWFLKLTKLKKTEHIRDKRIRLKRLKSWKLTNGRPESDELIESAEVLICSS